MEAKIFKGIMLKPDSSIEEIDLKLGDLDSILACEKCSGCMLEYMQWFGFSSVLFYNEDSDSDDLNKMAMLLAKDKKAIRGPSILIDDDEDITKDVYEKILSIAKDIPTNLWIPEPEIQKMLSDESLPGMIHEMILKNLGNESERQIVWDKVKIHYL